ncbi:MAG: hypothetical protein SF053_11125 [Bacteroidia bacterium]|nr:hypothetical protein [Bacteroidia bacterium]
MSRPQNYTLHYSEPCEYTFEIQDDRPDQLARMELRLTYYQGIARDELPLFIVIEDENSNIQEFATTIVLKKNEQWQGEQEKNEIDYTITHEAIPGFALKKGQYSMKIYSNDETNEKILGVVAIEARLFVLEAS